MTENIDLFGNPIAANHGRRGRPEHVPTVENRNKVKLLLALGWAIGSIAASLDVTPPTLRKHYFSELRRRAEMRARLDARRIERCNQAAEAGDVSAMRLFEQMVLRSDAMLLPAKTATPSPKAGKKEQAVLDANKADYSTPLGALIAERNAEDTVQ